MYHIDKLQRNIIYCVYGKGYYNFISNTLGYYRIRSPTRFISTKCLVLILCAMIIVYDWPWFYFYHILDPGYHIETMVSYRGFKILGFSMRLARNISSSNLPSISLLHNNMIFTVRLILELCRVENINSARLCIRL